jgi:DNA-binding transcriptional ArsR family regulator
VPGSTYARAEAPETRPANGDADVSRIAALLADPSRAAMVFAVGDGRALPAGELARHAGIARSTASEHLGKLVAGGLLSVERHGRHRYYRLNGPDVAEALEALAVLAPPRPTRDYREESAGRAIHRARTCYDHLAGWLGVEITDALVEHGHLDLTGRTYDLTASGSALFRTLGVEPTELAAGRRHFARACLDWSERRYHLAGALGAALTEALFDTGWVERMDATRAVRVTNEGRRAIRRVFGVRVF